MQQLTSSSLLSLLQKPLHLIIEGQTGSGKTWLAQQLARELDVRTEIWSSFTFPADYPIIPNAAIYQNVEWKNELPLSWQGRVEFWQKNTSLEKWCIVIDECPSFKHLSPTNFLIQYLGSPSIQNKNIILTTQSFDVLESLKEYLLKMPENSQPNRSKQFFVILLGLHAENHAKNVLKNLSLVEQIKDAQYPCLIGDRVIDLAEDKI